MKTMKELDQDSINSLFAQFSDIPTLVDSVRSDSIYGKFCKPCIVMYRWKGVPDITQTEFEFTFKMKVDLQLENSVSNQVIVEFSERWPYFWIKHRVSYFPKNLDQELMRKVSDIIGHFPTIDKISLEVNKDPIRVRV